MATETKYEEALMVRCALICLFLCLVTASFGQHRPMVRNLDTEPKAAPATLVEYIGGRFGYSQCSLTLYADSTFYYTNWLHTGNTWESRGTFMRSDSSITLRSDSAIVLKRRHQLKTPGEFDNITYRLVGGILKLYTKEQEQKDNSSYYPSYYTLYIKEDQ